MQPSLYIIAGCNGAGKSTASFTLLPDLLNCKEFVNADEIARGLSPFNPAEMAILAGKLMLRRIEDLLEAHTSFAIETTLSAKSYATLIHKVRRLGYRINLLFLWLSSVAQARDRVAHRVQEGGHNIAPDVIERRYYAGLANLREIFLPIVDTWVIVDNSRGENEIVATNNTVYNPEKLSKILSE
ncbi:zeta toxin family protein [uncultured Duncaniella sp.]|jgi:predicted ABC-type ATPase|uniref:zeta toxin family protein n=1 Tax=uncultured Duncaniella sp. TaxID=2768039 RepID=UPI00267628C9|nr:zeta toxin family protein [uncultured Duncaniella sp.]MCI9172949.1 zeta toxin [Muribaculaceae bacterium]